MTLMSSDDGLAAFRKEQIGIPDEHAEAFAGYTSWSETAVITRAVGPVVRQLLQHGYDAKGFRIHGKSCDWGPMAGFVMADAHFTKKGLREEDVKKEREQRDIAFHDRSGHGSDGHDPDHQGWVADTVPLQLYEQRVQWLRSAKVGGKPVLSPAADSATLTPGRIALDRGEVPCYRGVSRHPSNSERELHVVCIEETPLTPARDFPTQRVWGVYIDTQRCDFAQDFHGWADHPIRQLPRYRALIERGLEPMMALTNPHTHRAYFQSSEDDPERHHDFRNAVCGDYDLFAVWTDARQYNHDFQDRRFLGTQQGWSDRKHFSTLEATLFKRVSTEGTKTGNITMRVQEVAQMLNSGLGAATCLDDFDGTQWPEADKRNLVYHSDEGGRPFVQDVDLPLLAFFKGEQIPIRSVADFEALIRTCVDQGYQVTLNEGWVNAPGVDFREPAEKRVSADFAHLIPRWTRKEDGTPILITEAGLSDEEVAVLYAVLSG